MKIHITVDRFWNDNSSIERWPEILFKLPEKIEANSKYDIAKKYLAYPTDEKGRVLRSDEFYGLFGVEENNEKTIISGANFIARGEKGYFLTKEALLLRDCYQKDDKWEQILAKQLLTYSVRVRAVILGILNSEGICFSKKFLHRNREAYVEMGGEKYYFLNPTSSVKNLNDFMRKFGAEALGPYWKQKLDVKEEEIEILGTTKEEPSLSDIGTYLKMPLTLFQYLGWFREKDEGVYELNREKVKEDIGEDVLNSLLLEGFVKDTDILKELIIEYGDLRGYFPIEMVGEALKNIIDPQAEESTPKWIDRYFMEGIKSGKFKLIGSEQGQPRHGRGLLGDKEKQLIKLGF
ncbi:hypothetical protein [Clostridium kluyveri]|uniref:hypothetical protein n=1 Tax=Clostridium kluyveri TaxID=1534 RepID=UPI00224696F1|nr:hypothetical protein [Clostridium kluyveri]UZQ52410.1 hypothetical protein OP486_09710 [Clostridium kluyveri]